MGKAKLRVGLLMDGPSAPAYLHAVIRDLVDCDHAEIVVAIVSGDEKAAKAPRGSEFFFKRHDSRPRFLHDALRKGLWTLYTNLIERNAKAPDVDALVSLDPLMEQIPRLPAPSPAEGSSDQCSPADIESIRSHNLDLMVHAGTGTFCAELTRCARYGVWSFQSSPQASNDLPLLGSWESMRNSPVTESRLHIFRDDPGAGELPQRSWSCTHAISIQNTRNRVLAKTSVFMTRKIRELFELGEEEFFRRLDRNDHPPTSHSCQERDLPGTVELGWLLFRKILDKIKVLIRGALYFEQWILLFDFQDSLAIAPSGFQRITPPRSCFWADPFLVQRNDRYFVFFEEFSYRKAKGHISVMEMDEQGACTPPVTIIEQPYHLSYPFLFECEDDLYMIPESSANRTIEVYRCVEFPHGWELEKNLMRDVHAVDATLFEHEGTWWMFVNIAERPGASADDELFLFFADSPLSDNWSPHPQNPIVSDVRTARPAGNVFEWEGRIYRPSQNCAPIYGYGLNLNHIELLTKESYRESLVQAITPDWAGDLMGVHTFNRAGRLHVIDGAVQRRR